MENHFDILKALSEKMSTASGLTADFDKFLAYCLRSEISELPQEIPLPARPVLRYAGWFEYLNHETRLRVDQEFEEALKRWTEQCRKVEKDKSMKLFDCDPSTGEQRLDTQSYFENLKTFLCDGSNREYFDAVKTILSRPNATQQEKAALDRLVSYLPST